eukprot:1808644-Prymnesium_polylepis.1
MSDTSPATSTNRTSHPALKASHQRTGIHTGKLLFRMPPSTASMSPVAMDDHVPSNRPPPVQPAWRFRTDCRRRLRWPVVFSQSEAWTCAEAYVCLLYTSDAADDM